MLFFRRYSSVCCFAALAAALVLSGTAHSVRNADQRPAVPAADNLNWDIVAPDLDEPLATVRATLDNLNWD